jgi:hypothetical protein
LLGEDAAELEGAARGSPLGSKRASGTPNAFARKHMTFW